MGGEWITYPLPIPFTAHGFHLCLHSFDVAGCPFGGMDTTFSRSILGGEAKCIPANWMYDAMARHALHAGQDVGDGVDAQMAHMQGARRVWEHGQDVGLFAIHTRRLGCDTMTAPEILPFFGEGRQVVGIAVAVVACLATECARGSEPWSPRQRAELEGPGPRSAGQTVDSHHPYRLGIFDSMVEQAWARMRCGGVGTEAWW